MSYFLAITRIASAGSETLTLYSDKAPAKLLKLARRFIEKNQWYTDKSLYKALGDADQHLPSEGEKLFHVQGIIALEAGKADVREPRINAAEF